jgi:acyl-homoserine lactone acylase PvdQ
MFIAGLVTAATALGMATVPAAGPPSYHAEIRRTEFGVPHVLAHD